MATTYCGIAVACSMSIQLTSMSFGWHNVSIPIRETGSAVSKAWGKTICPVSDLAEGNYRVIGSDAEGWHYLDALSFSSVAAHSAILEIALGAHFTRIELLIDRRREMMQARP